MITALVLSSALAAGTPSEPAAASGPPVRVVAFRDADDGADCDPVEARYGRCVERVEFGDADLLAPGATKDARATLRNVSQLFAATWDDFAYRWTEKEDVLATTVQAGGFAALPPAPVAWDARDDEAKKHKYALPDPGLWLRDPLWRLPETAATEGGRWLFRQVRYHTRTDAPAPPAPLVLLSGRFALRLGFDGRPHDYDLMDADPQSSGPFLEQMYPYGARSFGPEATVLRRFAGVETGVLPPEVGDTYASLAKVAHDEFDVFARLVGVQVARYALQDFTENQMRVFAALTQMRIPPGALGERTGRTRDLVAAAMGQTDASADVDSRVEDRVFALSGDVRLRYEQIPEDVADIWLERLRARHGTTPQLLDTLNTEARRFLGELLRPDAGPLTDYDGATIEAWLGASLRTGLDRGPLVPEIKRLALRAVVRANPESQGRNETWLLIDHAHYAIARNLDDTHGKRVAPAEIATMASAEWKNTLALHGYGSKPIGQGLGAVDPTAICTTRDGREALAEPTVGAAYLDVVVDAPAGLTTADDVLWASKQQLPFLAVDDPLIRAPEVHPLVDLPGGRTLYRVRWDVWTGWHLLWGVEEAADGVPQLVVRTAAICDDMTLAPPTIVPTVVRAALLEGEYRPSTPVLSRDLAGRRDTGREPKEPLGADDALAQSQAAGEQGQKAAEDGQKAMTSLQTDGVTPDALQSGASALGGLFQKSTNANVEPVSADVQYIRDLVRTPLAKQAEDLGGMLLVVFDSATRKKPGALTDLRPRTPYARVQRPAGPGRAVRTASWTWWIGHGPKAGPAMIVSPAYRPTEAVATSTPMPRWKRNGSTDFSFGASMGTFPLRSTAWSCTEDSGDYDVVSPCEPGDPTRSDGMGVDLNALALIWFHDAPRLGFEVGPEARLDAVHSGESVAPGADDALRYAWAWRPQGGLLVGLRVAPLASGLWTGGAWPWAAERPDGTSRLGRFQMGLRSGMLLGPGFNGLELTAVGDVWGGWSIRSERSRQASLTPYHPGALVGPFGRVMYGFLANPDVEGYRVLDESWTFLVGVRGQVRLAGPPPSLPETSQ